MPSLRRTVRWGALGLLAALLGAAAGYVTLDTGDDEDRRSSSAPQADLAVPEAAELLGETPRSAIALDATTLVHIDLATGTEDVLGEIPSPDAAVDTRTARAVFTAPASADDPTPVLRLAPLDDLDDTTDLGPGTSPSLSPDGRYVAGVESSQNTRVVLYETDAEEQDPTYLLAEGNWDLVGWTTDDTLVVRAGDGAVFTTGPDDPEGTRLSGLRGTEIVLVSPTAPEALVRTDDSLAIRPLENGNRVAVRLRGGHRLGDAAWAPEGHWIAAATSGGARPGIALIDARRGTVEIVDGAAGAVPPVVWSTGKRHFGAIVSRGAAGFDILVCAVNGTCAATAPTDRPLRILALI